MWAHLAARSMLRAPSTMPAKSAATARTGTGICWHSYFRKLPITSLGTLDGASTSEAFGINNSGAVVGDSQSGNQNHSPVLFSNGSVQDLGLGGSNEPDALETAYAINDGGQSVGRHSAGNNAFHAFVFVNGNTTDFSTLGGANGEALAINKNCLVVGDSDTADGPAYAFVFAHSQLKDLGTLPGFDSASYARDQQFRRFCWRQRQRRSEARVPLHERSVSRTRQARGKSLGGWIQFLECSLWHQ